MSIEGNTRDIIQRFIYFFGVWEPNLTRWIGERLSPGDVFIDVGANIGYYSLLASNRVGGAGSVVAIEPSPSIFGCLVRNLALNGIRNVRTINMAVSHQEEVLSLSLGPDWNSGLTTTRTKLLEHAEFTLEAQVQAAPLGLMLTRAEIQNARLIKIDVEGAEWSVAYGMQPLLKDCHPDLEVVIEVVPEYLASRGKYPADILEIFQSAGFYPYGLPPEYMAHFYLSPNTVRPVRLHGTIEKEVNVVFSRRNVEEL